MAIEKYEPRVSVEDVVVQSEDGSNGISIMVSFKINGVEQPVSVSTFLQRVR
jgi:predicted component of type VI protein secretion system